MPGLSWIYTTNIIIVGERNGQENKSKKDNTRYDLPST